MSGCVIIADDDRTIRTVLSQALARAGYETRSCASAAQLWREIESGAGDVVISDVILPDENVFSLLPRIRRRRPRLPVVVMSAQNTIMTAIKAGEGGAFEYLPKPFDLNEMLAVVNRAVEHKGAGGAGARPGGDGGESLPIVGRSPAMQDVYRVIARLLRTDLTVLVAGESGTGKELVARVLHQHGKRRNKPFVAVNMAAIPHELIESELFGHEKGAFTGAGQRHAGRFEQAEGGTLFLDEIGDMPMHAQTRLLRVLQEGEYTSVGGSRASSANVRIVAATHRDLQALIAQGLFREDLYYRLNVVPVRLPPLRHRLDDIDDLVVHFLSRAQAEGLPHKHFTPGAIAALKSYSWPGNVRELENLLRRVVVIHPGQEIDEAIIADELASTATAEPATPPSGEASLAELVEARLAQIFSSHGDSLPPPGLYQRIIQEVEAPLIEASLAATNGNQVRAAELLGINRNTLRARINELNLDVVRKRGRPVKRGST